MVVEMHDMNDPETVANLIKKAKAWDALYKAVSEYYTDETGEYSEENPIRKGDLTDIGETACIHLGWL